MHAGPQPSPGATIAPPATQAQVQGGWAPQPYGGMSGPGVPMPMPGVPPAPPGMMVRPVYSQGEKVLSSLPA